MKKSLLISSLILLTGCAGTGAAFNAAQTPRPSSKAELIIYRPSSIVGAMFSPTTFINGVEKCDLPSGSFYYASVRSGIVKIEYSMLENSAKSSYSLDVQAGHKYYIRVSPDRMKAVAGNFGLVGAIAANSASDNEGAYSMGLADPSQAKDELESTKQTTSCK